MKDIALASYTVKTKSKGKKNFVVLSNSRPLHGKTIDDGKEKSQIMRRVMVALFYMLNTARVNGKNVWCLKNQMEILKKSSYNFGWELAKRLAMPHVQNRRLNGMKSSVQWEIKIFLGTAFKTEESLPKVEQRHKCTGKRRRCEIHMMNCQSKKEKDMVLQSTELCQSCGKSICRTQSMRICNICLQNRVATF